MNPTAFASFRKEKAGPYPASLPSDCDPWRRGREWGLFKANNASEHPGDDATLCGGRLSGLRVCGVSAGLFFARVSKIYTSRSQTESE
jgi:hypothetical protein